MKKAKLDRSRSFRSIIGISKDGVRYIQGDKDFDATGSEIQNDAPAPLAVAPMTVQEVVRKFPLPVKKKRKRRTKAQMATARAEKPALTKPAVLSTEVFK